jgi:hypothetical protein
MRTAALVAALGAIVSGIVLAGTAGPSAAASLPPGAVTLWGEGAPPKVAADPETRSVELGTAFSPKVAGTAIAVRFWKTPQSGGTNVGNLWGPDGTRLATIRFSGESSSRWQTAFFTHPVSLQPGVRYVVSYFAPQGRYAITQHASAASLARNLTLISSGIYAYGSTSGLPAHTWRESAYWADVVFIPSATGSTPTPTGGPTASQPPSPTSTPRPTPTTSSTPRPTTTPRPTPTKTPTAAPTPPPSGGGSSAGTPPQTSNTFAGPGKVGPSAAGFAPTANYTGPRTITTDGTVIRNQVIPAGLVVAADDVTIQGNLIVGSTDLGSDEATLRVEGARAKIFDNEIRGQSASSWSSDPVSGVKLVGDSPSFERNNVYWIAGDGVTAYGGNAKIIGNWIHDFTLRATVHYDALVYPDATTTQPGLIQDNRVELWVSDGMVSAMSFSTVAPKLIVDHNLLAGGNFTLMSGGGGITVTNNLFWTEYSPSVGYYGPTAHLGERPGVTWANNAYTDDGVTVGKTFHY